MAVTEYLYHVSQQELAQVLEDGKKLFGLMDRKQSENIDDWTQLEITSEYKYFKKLWIRFTHRFQINN